MNAKELEARFHVTSEQIETWAAECERGIYPDKASGKTIYGRPFTPDVDKDLSYQEAQEGH
jgi:hypothetical protein